MGNEDETPARRETVDELLLRHVTELRAGVGEMRAVLNRNHDLQLQMWEQLKQHAGRIERLERRVWVPALVSVMAALLCLVCVYRTAAP